jgi:hypothetical protein
LNILAFRSGSAGRSFVPVWGRIVPQRLTRYTSAASSGDFAAGGAGIDQKDRRGESAVPAGILIAGFEVKKREAT